MSIFSHGPWIEIQERAKADVHQSTLFENLKRTALLAKAIGTVTNYSNYLNCRIEFAHSKKLVVFPVSIVDAALYFNHLSTSQFSASTIESIYCALKWVHDIAGISNPISSPFVTSIVDGVKRQKAKPVVKKSPITKEALIACCIKYEHCHEFPSP